MMRIRGFLIDINGVLYVGSQVIPGAAQVVEYLQVQKIPHRFVTNNTATPVWQLAQKLQSLGLAISESVIFSTITATKGYLKMQGIQRIYPVLRREVQAEFAAEFEFDADKPQAVVIGDIGEAWDYQLMNQLFHYVIQGARIVALHKGKYWQTEEGLKIDIGAFVAGLEYVTGEEAVVIGKPSPEFFKMALRSLNLEANEVAMVGDDIESDVGGAKQLGMYGILVRTGKYREEIAYQSAVLPDMILDSIAALPEVWEKYGVRS